MIVKLTEEILRQLTGASGLWLFLDYDGTLAEFAPTPDHVLPNPQIIRLIADLAKQEGVRVAIISGRRLAHIRELLPVPGIVLAGTYGIEFQDTEGNEFQLVELASIQPVLDAIRARWSRLLANRQEIYLEDKGWTLALHARFASDSQAAEVLAAARMALDEIGLADRFRVLSGHKFLEVGPVQASKGQTVVHLLERFAWPGALLVYAGDDDKDEQAFAEIKSRGGMTIVVLSVPRPTLAEYRLTSPEEVRLWLRELIARLDSRNSQAVTG